MAQVACSALSLFYPCVASFTAIRTRDELAQTQWLMYWILNGLFVVFEEVFDFAVSSIPIYYEIKALLVVWLIAPGFNGASLLYTRFLAPWLNWLPWLPDSLAPRRPFDSFRSPWIPSAAF